MKKDKNIEQHNWDLLAKNLAGETSEAERKKLDSWISENEENRREYHSAERLFRQTEILYQSKSFDSKEAFEKVYSKIQNKNLREPMVIPLRKRFRPWLKYAALILSFLTVGILAFYLGNPDFSRMISQQVDSAESSFPREVTLADGTIVTLNSESRLVYPKNFKGNTREVEITGEAFFDVQPDPEKPFIIKAGETRVRVLGTSFNVNAYPGSNTVEVTVESGKVSVSNLSGTEKINEVVLDPGDKATYSKKEKKLTKKRNDDPNYVSWKTYSLKFDDSKLSYVFETLEKTYHIDIETENQDIENMIYTAQFKDKSLEFILDVIRLTFNLELSMENDHYTFTYSNI